MTKDIVKVCFTGGPCGGKSESERCVVDYATELGIPTIFVPEVATHLILEKEMRPGQNISIINFQKMVLRLTVRWYREALEKAQRRTEEKALIVFDRGVFDSLAYMEPDLFYQVLDELGVNSTDVLHNWYDMVIHMVTAADGAEEFYTLQNNSARSESPEQARELDKKTRQAWDGVTRKHVITNVMGGRRLTFEEKIGRSLTALSDVIGLPAPVQRQKKFLVRAKSSFLETFQGVCFQIEQFFSVPGIEPRIRFRKTTPADGIPHYTKTIKTDGPESGTRLVTGRLVTQKEYESAKSGPHSLIITKNRYCFSSGEHHFRLDAFQTPVLWCILEVDVLSSGDEVIPPDQIDIVRDVSGDDSFLNENI